jgi:small subunit ribosomal protein S9
MTDEENNETSEQPQEPDAVEETSAEGQDAPAAEGSDAAPAGPVAEEDPSSSQAAGDVPSSTPPADEASEAEAQDDAPEESAEAPEAEQEPVAAADEAADQDDEGADVSAEVEDQGSEGPADTDESAPEEPDSEAQEAEPEAAEEPEAVEEAPEEPKAKEAKEKKADVIPGADLEPIAVESEAPLSTEERARREAEEEERARREAKLSGDGADEESSVATRAPAEMDSDARFLATGKRKTSIARVTVMSGSGKIEINKRSLEEFFPRPLHQTIALQSLSATGYKDNVDIRIRVHGGGISGQAGAIRHGIARALLEIDPELRGELKRRGFLTRDARVKERRKAGLKKARKKPQFSKR